MRILVLSVPGLVCFCLGLWGACGASTTALPPVPDAETYATLAGPLCGENRCKCSEDPAAIGPAPEGYKRFAVTLGPSQHPLWASIGKKHRLYKDNEQATNCFYVDLTIGNHDISLRAFGTGSFGAKMTIREVGPKGLYDSFTFACGAPGLCDLQGLQDWKAEIAQIPKGKHAPCGSVRISGIDWKTGRMADNLHPADFRLRATMSIYKFLPHFPPGTADCKN